MNHKAHIANHVAGSVIRKGRMPALFSPEGHLFWLSEYGGLSCWVGGGGRDVTSNRTFPFSFELQLSNAVRCYIILLVSRVSRQIWSSCLIAYIILNYALHLD
jgi:hypothetical protein